ncbi:MAG: type II toxin-antitoxin system VapC family toxin [Actinobacteria bacterium]|nr:type II toxin-antitoxin system VapC family toxin [Actinomycetota bacterium]
MRLILDTNIFYDYAEGKPEVVDVIASKADEICFSSIVLGELYYGFLKSSQKKLNEKKIEQFIDLLNVEIIEVDENVCRKYALIYEYLEKKGCRIPINDVWIAACCMADGGTLLTRDNHFNNVEQIEKIII